MINDNIPYLIPMTSLKIPNTWAKLEILVVKYVSPEISTHKTCQTNHNYEKEAYDLSPCLLIFKAFALKSILVLKYF